MSRLSKFIINNGVVVLGQHSDGDPSRWPSNTKEVILPDGTVNFYDRPTDHMDRHWKKEIADYLVKQSGKVLYDPDQQYILHEFPEGYRLFTQKKGDRHTPRNDTYLIGSRHINRFRSPGDFREHAVWLDGGGKLDGGKPLCGCKLCHEKFHRGTEPQVVPSRTVSSRSAGHGEQSGRGRETDKIYAKDYTILADGFGSNITFDSPDSSVNSTDHQGPVLGAQRYIVRDLEGIGGAVYRDRPLD